LRATTIVLLRINLGDRHRSTIAKLNCIVYVCSVAIMLFLKSSGVAKKQNRGKRRGFAGRKFPVGSKGKAQVRGRGGGRSQRLSVKWLLRCMPSCTIHLT